MDAPTRRPKLGGVLETALYVADVERAAAFYRQVFGFPVLFGDSRLCALDVEGAGARQVLLLFLQGGTREPVRLPGGVIPEHDGSGTTHFAFAIPSEELRPWEAWLAAHDVAIESRVRWERGGTSLYFRDPDGHLVELATPGVWPTY